MQIRALAHSCRIQEISVSYRRRKGVSKITGTLWGTLAAGTKIISLILWFTTKAYWGGSKVKRHEVSRSIR